MKQLNRGHVLSKRQRKTQKDRQHLNESIIKNVLVSVYPDSSYKYFSMVSTTTLKVKKKRYLSSIIINPQKIITVLKRIYLTPSDCNLKDISLTQT